MVVHCTCTTYYSQFAALIGLLMSHPVAGKQRRARPRPAFLPTGRMVYSLAK